VKARTVGIFVAGWLIGALCGLSYLPFRFWLAARQLPARHQVTWREGQPMTHSDGVGTPSSLLDGPDPPAVGGVTTASGAQPQPPRGQ
jgi:hypothetical protein